VIGPAIVALVLIIGTDQGRAFALVYVGGVAGWLLLACGLLILG
jgi:hypothetical protein